jgi:hypothetical protein
MGRGRNSAPSTELDTRTGVAAILRANEIQEVP